MDRPKKYAEHRFIGDKRSQVLYDLDADLDPALISELVESEQVTTFGPDTRAEARNRGYKENRFSIRGVVSGLRNRS